MNKLEKWMTMGIGILCLIGWGVYQTVSEDVVNSESSTDLSFEELANKSDRNKKISSAIKRYDAALYWRASPIVDPFHAEDCMNNSIQNLGKEIPLSSSEIEMETVQIYPQLIGVISVGSEAKAIFRTGKEIQTGKEGEHIGEWVIIKIQSKSVRLQIVEKEIECSL